MGGYSPLYIKKNETGLVQSRQEFILPDDAYPILENAIIFREQIRRKQGFTNIEPGNPASSRLSRSLTTASFGTITAPGAGTFTFSIVTGLIGAGSITAGETGASIAPGSLAVPIVIVIGPQTLTDTTGTGTLVITGVGSITAASISYSSGTLILTFSGAIGPLAATITTIYYPTLPVMSLRTEETANSANDNTVAFDMVYAYQYDSGTSTWNEFLPGTTWTGSNSQFMWTTNFFVGAGNVKIFWATNNNDPIRFTNGVAGFPWFDFAPQINAAGGLLTKCLAMLPFRGRLVAFNTTETGTGGGTHTNRIRWAAIGTPFTKTYGTNGPTFNNVVATFNANAWRDDIRGQGGFLDIPTSEDITSVGFVRDNCVIYCERSTWQLRYTGRSIAPFQIERVNSELGVESLFSSVQFDTTLVGIGDKGIVECDSYKSERIDVKIPDLVFNFTNSNQGVTRVQGIRDFVSRLAYWTFPSSDRAVSDTVGIFPDKLLVYNYENDSWGIWDDSFTCLGNFQESNDRTWINTPIAWIDADFPWISEPLGAAVIVAGNQQGFVVQLANQLDALTTNDPSLTITNITGNTTTPTVITSPNHNLQTGAVIEISGIISATPFANLNTSYDPVTGQPLNIFSIIVLDANRFQLMKYNPTTLEFSTPQLDDPNTGYLGIGFIAVRDNFNVTSKKFNFVDQGQSIQLGYLDILMSSTTDGAISLNMYVDYKTDEASNILPQNVGPDTFFNATIPSTQSITSGIEGTKFWQRVYCPTRGNFLTLQYKFSNAQMNGIEQEQDVQIDAQVLWIRPGGRLTQP